MTRAQPFGTWDSPISAKMVTTAGVRLGDVAYAGGAAFWAEARPTDKGRNVIVKRVVGQPPVDLTHAPFNVRTQVHEYGGGAWWVDAQYLYFVHWIDQRLYRVSHINDGSSNPSVAEPLTPEAQESQLLRYADGCANADSTLVYCVRERHEVALPSGIAEASLASDAVSIETESGAETETGAGTGTGAGTETESHSAQHVHNELVVIATAADSLKNKDQVRIRVITSGADFYSTPRLSTDGTYLTWVQWSHPQMPWDGTELMLADVQSDGSIENIRTLAGDTNTSVMGAMWSRDGQVIYADDKSGWWNIYRYCPTTQRTQQLTHFDDREVGTPAWVFGTQRFVELFDGTSVLGLAMLVTHQAGDQLQVLTPEGVIETLNTAYSTISSMAADDNGGVLLHAQAQNSGATITLVDFQSHLVGGLVGGEVCGLSSVDANRAVNVNLIELKSAQALGVDNAWLSAPDAISFPSGGRQAHAFFYPPAGHNLTGIENELPPLIVMGHGGPTSHATDGMKLSIQYWTSRGIAVVDVNYGGSSGFGRDYRRLLNGQWGVVDVEDCVAATDYLSGSGRVDAERMVIRGGSAGGLTVLRALQTSERFAGGTSLYGVTDLEMLAGDTHKFESRYLDGLLGGPYPEHKATYVERSPITHAEQLSCPILVLQGDEDKVVPPNQSAAIANAAAKKSLPHAYVLFAGEQHGFRKTDNIIRALQLELWFYGCVLSFKPANNIGAPDEAVGFE